MKGSRLSVADIRAGLQDLVASLDVASLEPDEATRLLEEFSVVNKSSSAAMSLLALRVTECGVGKASGERSDADWLAKKTGEAVGVCRSALETAKNLSSSPKTDEAFRKGELSSRQANAISSAVVVSPTSEDLLLKMAEHQSLKDLQDQCDRIKAACDPDPIAKQARIHKSRYWRKWTDRDGARCGQYRLTPELGALLEKSAQPFIEQVFKEAWAKGDRESSEAYAADGLIAMAQASRGEPEITKGLARSKGELVLLVNLESLQRGSLAEGEICEIPGIGPVSLSVAQDVLGSWALKLAITNGVAVQTVVHGGRSPNAVQRTAILVRDKGRCVRPSCFRAADEIDHIAEWSKTHETTLDQLAGLCRHDHKLKTDQGHSYRQGPRGWQWHRPDGVIEYQLPPPDSG